MTANRRWAELNVDTVLRVIVYDGDDPTDLLGAGTWVETVPEIDPDPTDVNYCGPGYRYASNRPELFASEWTQPVADLETGWEFAAYAEGAVVWHLGALYRSTTPVNVWEPGVAGWHGTTGDGTPSPWIQPSGSADAYQIGQKVTHDGFTWENTSADNVFAPGVFGWTNLTPPVGPQPWVQPTGAGDAYTLGALVTHNGQTWENTGSNANVWEPGVFGWVVV